MYDEINVRFRYADERADIRAIRSQLRELAEQEATKLFRLAWRAQRHGCSPETVRAIREEARELHMSGYPERLVDGVSRWRYAFHPHC